MAAHQIEDYRLYVNTTARRIVAVFTAGGTNMTVSVDASDAQLRKT